jgi:hypothetical protein
MSDRDPEGLIDLLAPRLEVPERATYSAGAETALTATPLDDGRRRIERGGPRMAERGAGESPINRFWIMVRAWRRPASHPRSAKF